MELLFLIVVVIAVAAFALLAFAAWLVAAAAKAVWRLVRPKRAAVAAAGQTCPNADCRCESPDHARFCRRCGRALPSLMRLVDARAA